MGGRSESGPSCRGRGTQDPDHVVLLVTVRGREGWRPDGDEESNTEGDHVSRVNRGTGVISENYRTNKDTDIGGGGRTTVSTIKPRGRNWG